MAGRQLDRRQMADEGRWLVVWGSRAQGVWMVFGFFLGLEGFEPQGV